MRISCCRELIGAVVALCAVSATAQPAAAQASLVHLALDLGVDYKQMTVAGTAQLRLRNVGNERTREVALLLNRGMRVRDVRLNGQRVARYSQGVVAFRDDSARRVNQVRVALRSPLAPGDSATLRVSYAGVLEGYAETGTAYIKDHVDPAFTIIREDAYAFPVLGQASWSAYRSQPRRDFAFAATVRVPAGQVVAAPGIAARATQSGTEMAWSYRSDTPVPFLNIAIAPYGVIEAPGVRVFHFKDDAYGAARVVRAVTDARRLLTDWYGSIESSAAIAIMEIPPGYGSQASLTGGIIQTQDAFRDPTELRQLYHELSHLWNARDADVPAPRWNEGLAMFLQYRIAEELDGWGEWTRASELAEVRIGRTCGQSAACDSVPLAHFGKHGLTDLSYSVGYVLFRLLYLELGATRFDSTYRALLHSSAKNGVTTDALAAAYSATGSGASRIVEDWLLTSRWKASVSARGGLAAAMEAYVR